MRLPKNLLSIKIVLNSALVSFVGISLMNFLDYLADNVVLQTASLQNYLIYYSKLLADIIPFITIFSVFLFFFVKPIQAVYNKLQQNIKPDDNLMRTGKKRLIELQTVIIIINLFGFVSGSIFYLLNRNLNILALENILYVLFSVFSGGVYSFLQISINNQLLIKLRNLLKIYYIDADRKGLNIGLQYKTIIFFSFFAIFSMCFLLSHNLTIAKHYIPEFSQHITPDSSERELQTGGNQDSHERSASVYYSYIAFNLISFFTLLAIGLFIQFVYSQEFSKRINFQYIKIKDILEGRQTLKDHISIIQYDEIDKVTDIINRLMDKLNEILDQTSSSSVSLVNVSESLNNDVSDASSAIEEMISAIKQVSHDTNKQIEVVELVSSTLVSIVDIIGKVNVNIENQSSFIEETFGAMTEMANNIKSVNNITGKTNELAKKLVVIANNGGTSVDDSINAIKKIEEASKQIMDIINIIKDIASRTDLLSMNAAIEAAHASEAGKGFAVVAEEIRNLAENSANQAREIEKYIKDMTERIKKGVSLSVKAQEAFVDIYRDINNTTNLINEVTSAMQEQSMGTNQILSAVGSVVRSSQELKESIQELKQKSEDIRVQMNELVQRSTHINSATNEQDKGNADIIRLIESVKIISNKNLTVASDLKNTFSNFKI
jgi:methyl-accepting chemotaxis protein